MELVGEKSRHSLQENLHLIRTPVLVVWGTEDQVYILNLIELNQVVLIMSTC